MNRLEKYFGQTMIVAGILSDDPEFKKDDYRLQIRTEFGLVYVMLKSLPQDVSLGRSDQITLQGTVQPGFGNFAAFLYRPKIVAVSHPSTPDFALSIRSDVSQSVQAQIDDVEQSNLALSYLTGQKNLLSETQQQKLRLAGLAHVVVASGFHLSLVITFARKIFRKVSRFAIFSMATMFLIIFISITGFSPSMARAGLITFLTLWAWYYGRRFHPARLILYVMAITLLLDPSYITNLAWQLSFASYAGIVFLSPLLTKFLYGKDSPGYFSSLIIASVSAQLFCLPFTLYYFGVFPILALLANVLISPTIPFVMLGTLLLALTHLVPIVFITQKILAFQQFVVDSIAAQSWASFEIGLGQGYVFLLYIPLFVAILLLKWRTKHSFRPSYELAESPDYGKIYTC